VGPGHGFPKLPSETAYVANELRFLLSLKDQLAGLPGPKLGVDLSNVVLYSQPWRGIDFSWVNHYSRGLDLRGANMEGSRWGTSYLGYSYLQCARLAGAVFGLPKSGGGFLNASLVSADLTNANLNGVDLSKAVNLDRAKGLDKAILYKPPPASAEVSPYEDDVDACLKNGAYWDPPTTS